MTTVLSIAPKTHHLPIDFLFSIDNRCQAQKLYGLSLLQKHEQTSVSLADLFLNGVISIASLCHADEAPVYDMCVLCHSPYRASASFTPLATADTTPSFRDPSGTPPASVPAACHNKSVPAQSVHALAPALPAPADEVYRWLQVVVTPALVRVHVDRRYFAFKGGTAINSSNKMTLHWDTLSPSSLVRFSGSLRFPLCSRSCSPRS